MRITYFAYPEYEPLRCQRHAPVIIYSKLERPADQPSSATGGDGPEKSCVNLRYAYYQSVIES